MIDGFWAEFFKRSFILVERGWVWFSETVSLTIAVGFCILFGLVVGYGWGANDCKKPTIVIKPPAPKRVMKAIELRAPKPVKTIEIKSDG